MVGCGGGNGNGCGGNGNGGGGYDGEFWLKESGYSHCLVPPVNVSVTVICHCFTGVWKATKRD